MKLPKIVSKKRAEKLRKERKDSEAELSLQHNLAPRPSDAFSSPTIAQQPKLGHSQSLSKARSASAASAAAPLTSKKQRVPSLQVDLSRSSSSRLDYSMHSASSTNDDDDSDATSRSSSNISSNSDDGSSSFSSRSSVASSSASASTYNSSRRTSTQSSSTSTRSNSCTVSAPSVEAPAKPVRTQYSAYARNMISANRRRRLLPRTNSSVNFDGADEFFDKSDSSLGVGSSPSLSFANDKERHQRSSESDAQDDDEVAAVMRPVYRSGIPTGRRMTQKEILQRKLLREMEEEAVLARPCTKPSQPPELLQQQQLQHQSAKSANQSSTKSTLRDTSVSRSGTAAAAATATSSRRRPSHSSSSVSVKRTLTDKDKEVPPLTATFFTAPVLNDSESRQGPISTSSSSNDSNSTNSHSTMSPMGLPPKKQAGGLLGWRRKLLQSTHKSSSSTTTTVATAKEGKACSSAAASPSNRSTSNASRAVLTTSTPTSSMQRTALTAEGRRGVSSAGSAPHTGPNGSIASASLKAATTRSTAKAAIPAAPGVTTTQVPISMARLRKLNEPISKETLRSLDNKQLSKLDFSTQKARKSTHPRSISPADAGLLSAGPTPSLMSSGGYGSFMDAFASSRGSFVEADTQSTGSRRSHRSNRSSSSHRSRSSHGSSASRRSHRRGEDDDPHRAAPTPKATSGRSSSFFRALFRSSSGGGASSGKAKRSGGAGGGEGQRGTPRRASAAQATASKNKKNSDDTTRTRPTTTAAVGALRRDGGSVALERQLSHHYHPSQRASESPGSDVSGMGTSLYRLESELSSRSSSRSGRLTPRRRARLSGSLRRRGTVAEKDGTTHAPADELNDSFGSLFKGDGVAAAVSLYGRPSVTPSDLGTAPTPGGGGWTHNVSNKLGVTSPLHQTSRASASPSLTSPQQQQQSMSISQLASFFPNNSCPRAGVRATVEAAVAASVDRSVGGGRDCGVSVVAPPNAPHQQNLTGTSATITSSASATKLSPSQPAAVGAGAHTSAKTTGTSVAGNGVDSQPGSSGVEDRQKGTSTVSPAPVCDEFSTTSLTVGAAVHGSNRNLHYFQQPSEFASSDDASTEAADTQGSSRGRRHHRVHRHHNDTGATTYRKSSFLPSGDGFRVRRRTSGDGIEDRQSSGGAKVTYPPLGVPSSNDPRRPESSRHSGTAVVVDAASDDTQRSRTATAASSALKPIHNSNSASLLPQPPTLSNTESKNYRGSGNSSSSMTNANITTNTNNSNTSSGSGGGGTSFNAAIAPLQGSSGMLPTRADSKDFLLRHNRDGEAPATTATTPAAAAAAAVATAAVPRQTSHESSRRHHRDSGKRSSSRHGRSRRSSNASSRYDGSFSFSSESLLDGKARGQLAKAAAATSSVERRRGLSSHSLNNSHHGGDVNDGADGGGGAGRRQASREQCSNSSRGSQHFLHGETSPRHSHSGHTHHDGTKESHRHRRKGRVHRSGDVELFESSGSQRRRRSRHDLYGSSRRTSSASVSLVAGLGEVLPHKPMQPRNGSASTVSSAGAASSSRNSSASSGDGYGEPVGRNSVRCLRKMAAKARDASNSSSVELDVRGHPSNDKYHSHSKTLPTAADTNTTANGGDNAGPQLALVQPGGSAPTTGPVLCVPRVASGNGSGTIINSNPNGGAYAMKLPSFKPNIVAESSSSNDVSTDRPANSGGSRHQQQLQYIQRGGSDVAVQHLQRMPLTMSHDGSGNAVKGSGNFLLQPVRSQGSNPARHNASGSIPAHNNTYDSANESNAAGAGPGNNTRAGEKDAYNSSSGSGGDRVVSGVEHRSTAAVGAGGAANPPGSAGLATLPPVHKQHLLGSASSGGGGGGGDGSVRASVPSALLAQPRDNSTKRRRPTTESFTPWSVDMSRFNKLRQEQNASAAVE
jgi:hypothetical protein